MQAYRDSLSVTVFQLFPVTSVAVGRFSGNQLLQASSQSLRAMLQNRLQPISLGGQSAMQVLKLLIHCCTQVSAAAGLAITIMPVIKTAKIPNRDSAFL
jgi:hypothetical protein